MGGWCHRRRGGDGGRVLLLRDRAVRDWVPLLLLEQGLRCPGHAALHHALHQEQWRLPMVNAGEHRRAGVYLRPVDRLCEVLAAGLVSEGMPLIRPGPSCETC